MDVDKYLDMLHNIDEHSSRFRSCIEDCTWQEFRVLDLAAKQPSFRLNDIGNERSVYQQGIGRIAARLAKKGLADVIRNERDGRARNLVLTDKGRQVRAKCRRVLSGLLA